MKIHLLVPSSFFLLPLAVSCSEGSTPGGSGGAPPVAATGGSLDPGAGGVGSMAGGADGAGGFGNAPSAGGTSGAGNTGGADGTGNAPGAGGGGVGGTPNTGGSGSAPGSGGDVNTGGAEGAGGSPPAAGGAPVVEDPPPLQNPQDGRATHYWDCCKPSCAWPDQGSARSCTRENQLQSNPDEQSGCFGGNSYQCWNMSAWAASDTLAYGFAAFNGDACGACYQLEFTGTSSAGYDDPGSAALSNKIMIVQTLNRGGIGQGQFDLLIPGGGVGDFDACSSQWNASGNLGERYGGFFLECRNQNNGNHEGAKSCARDKCNSVFGGADQGDLLAGCLFWLDWANMADNPNFKYGQVECPDAISETSGM
jgi:hypothetical protein